MGQTAAGKASFFHCCRMAEKHRKPHIIKTSTLTFLYSTLCIVHFQINVNIVIFKNLNLLQTLSLTGRLQASLVWYGNVFNKASFQHEAAQKSTFFKTPIPKQMRSHNLFIIFLWQWHAGATMPYRLQRHITCLVSYRRDNCPVYRLGNSLVNGLFVIANMPIKCPI